MAKYDLFIKTLERGRDIGLGRKFNISDILQQEFLKPTTSTDQGIWLAEVDIQLSVLYAMKGQLHLIDFSSLETNKIKWDPQKNKPIWFDETDFEVWVTVTGLDYLNQYYLRQSNFSLNGTLEKSSKEQADFTETAATNSTRQANFSKYQTWIAAFTGLFVLGSLGTSFYTISRDNRVDKLELILKRKDSAIEINQIDITRLQFDTARLRQEVRNFEKGKEIVSHAGTHR